jgi:hypothetical protein
MATNALKGFMAEHPKLISALFTLMILWAQFGTVIATGGGNSGP